VCSVTRLFTVLLVQLFTENWPWITDDCPSIDRQADHTSVEYSPFHCLQRDLPDAGHDPHDLQVSTVHGLCLL